MHKIRLFLTLFLSLLMMGQIAAQKPTVSQKQRLEMKKLLHELIKTHKNLGYDNLWTAYEKTDVDATGHIIDMYSNITNFLPSDHSENYQKEGDVINREHTVPQSWFDKKAPMVADIHHVYPVDGWVNGMRSDYPYGEVATVSKKSANSYSKLGTPKTTLGAPASVNKVFEPADEWKGDLARAYFYMVVCYQEQIDTWSGGVFGQSPKFPKASYPDYVGYPGIAEWALKMFLRWAKNDPVSQREIDRNNAAYKLQGNRNPFIDCPGIERFIWAEYVE